MAHNTICFFNTNREWGGGEKWHLDVARRLYQAGKDILILADKKAPLYAKAQNTGIPAIHISVSNLSFVNLPKHLHLKNIFVKHGVDTVILNLPSDVKFAGISAKMAGVRRIIYRRGSALPIRNSFLNRFLLKHVVDDILVNSYETKRNIFPGNNNILDASKITVIYNGLKTNYLDTLPDTLIYHKKQDEVVLGNLGRMVDQKAQHYLLDVAQALKQKNIQCKLIIGGDGPLKNKLISLSYNKGLESDVIFPGFVNNVKAFAKSIDIFLLPSLWEGFGYVLAEAMYFKKPVVAFNTSSNPELIINEENGYLVEFKNLQQFAEKIEKLASSPQLRHTMGERGKKIVKEKFDFENNFKSLKSFILE